jgi:hypothetical protein
MTTWKALTCCLSPQVKEPVFVGTKQDGLRHGFGCIEYPEGAEFRGQWANDQPEGAGAERYPKLFVCDTALGPQAHAGCLDFGTSQTQTELPSPCRYSDGSTYEGFYKAGMRHGVRQRSVDWTLQSNGIHCNLALTRQVCLLLAGLGFFALVNGVCYLGNWKNGRRDGYGIIAIKKRGTSLFLPVFLCHTTAGKHLTVSKYKSGESFVQEPKRIGSLAGQHSLASFSPRIQKECMHKDTQTTLSLIWRAQIYLNTVCCCRMH